MNQIYKENRPLLHKIVREFHRRYRGSIRELESEANLHFVQAVRSYKPSRAKLSTWLYSQIWSRLLDTKRKQARRARIVSMSNFTDMRNESQEEELEIPQPTKFDFESSLMFLSKDARKLARLAIFPTPKLLSKLPSRNIKPNQYRKALLSHLKETYGWSASRVHRTLQELGEVL